MTRLAKFTPEERLERKRLRDRSHKVSSAPIGDSYEMFLWREIERTEPMWTQLLGQERYDAIGR